MKVHFAIPLLFIFVISPFYLQGCQCDATVQTGESVLKTDLPGETKPVLLFSEVKIESDNIKRFLLYVKGYRPLHLHKLELSGEDKENYTIEGPKLPLLLEPGKENGKSFTVRFKPTGVGYFRANLTFYQSKEAQDQDLKPFTIRLTHQEIRSVLFISCGKILDFQEVGSGQFRERNCTLSNKGNIDLHLKKIVIRTEQGDKQSFSWKLSKALPISLKAQSNDKLSLKIRYQPAKRPFQPKMKSDISTLLLYTNISSSKDEQSTKLRLEGKLLQNPLHLVPVYPTCKSDESCKQIDSNLSCKIEELTEQKRCQHKDPKNPILLFPSIAKSGRIIRTFLIKNRSHLPIALMSFEPSYGAFRVLNPGHRVEILPDVPLQIFVEFTQIDDKPHQHFLDVKVRINGHEFKKTILLRTQSRSCILKVEPKSILFLKESTRQLTLENIGKSPCVLNSMEFKWKERTHFDLKPTFIPGTTLQLGDKRTFVLSLKTKEPQSFSDILTIKSNDGAHPRLDIPIEDRKTKRKPCMLRTDKEKIDFGRVGVGESLFQTLVIGNIGSGECTLTRVALMELRPVQNTPVKIEEIPFLPMTLGAEKTLRLRLDFSPMHEGLQYTGELHIQEKDLSKALVIQVKGNSSTSCLQWTKRIHAIDFGMVPVSCSGKKKLIQLYHSGAKGCPEHIQIKDIRCGEHSCGPVHPTSSLQISNLPLLPAVLSKERPFTFTINYHPKKTGSFQQELKVIHTLKSQPPLPILIRGNSHLRAEHTDNFTELALPKTDILLVIDNSNAMLDKQANLVKNLNDLIQWLIRLNVNYQIGIITTDTSGKHYPAGCLQGHPKIITPETPHIVNTFLRNARVGTLGHAFPRGLEAAYQALTSRLNEPKCNRGFLRKGANLNITFISGKEDQSLRTIGFYTHFFRNLKGFRNLDLLRASSIVGPPPSGCRNPGTGQADASSRYWQIAKNLRGVRESICRTNWAATLSNIGSIPWGYRTQYFLSYQADPKTIQVKVNGKLIKRDPQDGWQYESTNNSVNFSKSQDPPPQAKITVTYKYTCK